jgi:rod shape-determining protein MreC
MSLTRPLTWFIGVFILGLAMVAFTQAPGSDGVRGATQLLASPVETVLRAVFSPISDFVTNVSSYGDLRRENQRLEANNQRLNVQIAQLQEQATQNGQLADLAAVARQRPSDHFVGAGVIARDPSTIHDQIEIDRGSDDGVRPGMTVVGSGGAVVGTVRQTLSDRSWVALITDSQSNVNAMIQESRALAILRGSVDKHLAMQFVSQSIDVKVGDTVMTSGLGGGYPSGYLLGRVSAVQGQPMDMFKRVTVEPAARLDSLEHVLVLTSFSPASTGR